MCAASFNPKRCKALDVLRKAEVSLLAVSSNAAYLGRTDPLEKSREMAKRLEKLGPRGNRTEVMKELVEHLRLDTAEAYGCSQVPIMLTSGPDVYAAFIPELMSSDELFAFRNTWRIRGIRPATVLAYKTEAGGSWSYTFVNDLS
jgi:hypothetical protein